MTCGIWLAVWSTSWSARWSMTATQPRPSIGAMHWRPVEIVRVDLDRRIERRRNAGIDGRLEENVVAPMLVHERGARLARRAHVADRRQFLEVQGYARRDILGFGARRRDAHRDELADMPDLAGRERRLLGDLEAGQSRHGPDRVDAVQIRRGEHPIPNGVGNFDAANAGMGERAADEGDVLHAGEADIADILPQAPHQALVLLARQPGADALGRFRVASASVNARRPRSGAAPRGRAHLLDGAVLREW